jgi:hypothetical protein
MFGSGSDTESNTYPHVKEIRWIISRPYEYKTAAKPQQCSQESKL